MTAPVSAFPVVTIGYSALCDVLMHGLTEAVSTVDGDLLSDETAATMRAVAMLVTGAYGNARYYSAFALIKNMHVSGEVAGTIALRLLSEYGHAA